MPSVSSACVVPGIYKGHWGIYQLVMCKSITMIVWDSCSHWIVESDQIGLHQLDRCTGTWDCIQ
jgi:hypothetical protein